MLLQRAMGIHFVSRPYWRMLWQPEQTLTSLRYYEPANGTLLLPVTLGGLVYAPALALIMHPASEPWSLLGSALSNSWALRL